MKYEDNEEFTWYELIEYHLGPRNRKLPLKQMLLYLRSCIIRPAQLQIFTFFSMYESIMTECKANSINLINDVCIIPAGNIKVYNQSSSVTKTQIFEYEMDYLLSTEDKDLLILQCKGYLPAELDLKKLHKPEHKKMNNLLSTCTSPYPTLFNAVDVKTDDILNDFAFQFSTSSDFHSPFNNDAKF